MAHQPGCSSYESLVERLNRLPQGAPPSDTLYTILKLLFSEQEAGLVAQLPIRPCTAGQAAKIWKMKECAAQKVLDDLSSRAILLDIVAPDGVNLRLPPIQQALASEQMRSRYLVKLLEWGKSG